MEVARRQHIDEVVLPDGGILLELLGTQSAQDAPTHGLAIVEIPESGTHLPHFHKLTEESFTVLTGCARFRVDGVEADLQVNDALLIRSGEVHQVTNLGRAPLRLLSVSVPPWDANDTYFAAHVDTTVPRSPCSALRHPGEYNE